MGIDREGEKLLDSRAVVCGARGSADPGVSAMGCWILVCQSLIEGKVNFRGEESNNSVLLVSSNWGKRK